MEEKTDKLDYKRIKRQTIDWEKIFATLAVI